MAMWKMRWRDKEGRKKRKLKKKGSEEIEKEKDRTERTELSPCVAAGNSNEGKHLMTAYILSQQIS